MVETGEAVSERRVSVGGLDTFLLEAGAGDVPLVCVHGNPDSAELWRPLVERSSRLGRVIAPDMPGFGRSVRPDPRRFDMTVDAYVRWFGELLETLEIERLRLAVHDWGVIALAAASRRPEMLERVVIVDAVALSSSYRWHWIGRLWRTPRLGEAAQLFLSGGLIKQLTRLPSPHWRPMPDPWVKQIGRFIDRGEKDAMLRLYRSADPDVLGRAGERLGDVRCPALLIWGEGDPYIGLDHARELQRVLPESQLEIVPGVGHWSLVEQPELYERIADFVAP